MAWKSSMPYSNFNDVRHFCSLGKHIEVNFTRLDFQQKSSSVNSTSRWLFFIILIHIRLRICHQWGRGVDFAWKLSLLKLTSKKSLTYEISLNACYPAEVFRKLYCLENFADFLHSISYPTINILIPMKFIELGELPGRILREKPQKETRLIHPQSCTLDSPNFSTLTLSIVIIMRGL